MSHPVSNEPTVSYKTITSIAGALSVIIAGAMLGCPHYGVYRQRLEGEALLAHAQAAKEVAVATAKAEFEAADFKAKADIRRAEGEAQANKIIGDSLKNNDARLRYLWIQNLEKSEGSGSRVIYVPTEAGLPILESQRLAPHRGEKE